MILRNSYFYTVLSILFSFHYSRVQLALKNEVIEDFKNNFLPTLFGKTFKDIPEQELGKIEFMGIRALAKNISVSIPQFDVKDIILVYKEPNKLRLFAKNIMPNCSFDLEVKIPLYEETDKVEFNITKFNIEIEVELDVVQSQNKKLLPTGSVTELNILELDFDLSIKGKFLGRVANWIRKLIKNKFVSQIKNDLRKQIVNESKKRINEIMSVQSGLFSLESLSNITKKFDLHFDYSLLDKPQIKNGSLFITTTAGVVQRNQTTELVESYNFQTQGVKEINKKLSVVLTDTALNNALHNLAKSGVLKIEVGTDNLNELLKNVTNIKLNTATLDVFFKKFTKYFGTDRPVTFECAIKDDPNFKIANGSLYGIIPADCSIYVNYDKIKKLALRFTTIADVEADFNFFPDGEIVAKVVSLLLHSTKAIDNPVKADITYVEQLFDFITYVGIPIANKNLLNYYKFNMTDLGDIGAMLKDSEIRFTDEGIHLQINPDFNHLPKLFDMFGNEKKSSETDENVVIQEIDSRNDEGFLKLI